MNYKKSFYFDKDRFSKMLSFEISGFDSSPSIKFAMEGSEREVVFHIAFLIGLWITVRGIPDSWFPQEYNSYGKQYYPCDREIRLTLIDFHLLVFSCWLDPNSWHRKDNGWRQWSINFQRLIQGKHNCEFINIETKQMLLPFYEGNYNVEVIKKMRIDSWQRWFTRMSISFEVKCGYYNNDNKWIDVPIPHEGKGENSWDCGEDATWSSSFPATFRRNKKFAMKTCEDAALYFWQCMMETRIRYGGSHWMPKIVKQHPLSFIKTST